MLLPAPLIIVLVAPLIALLPVGPSGISQAIAQATSEARHVDEDNGFITISDARLSAVRNIWQLDARAEVRLSPVMRDGLDSGVPLQFVVEVALVQPRRWWFDSTVFAFERRYTLTYYELTRHYRLQESPAQMIKGEPDERSADPGTGAEQGSSRNFRSLLAALDAMSTLRGIALDAGQSKPRTGVSLVGELEIRLDDSALPLPLQPVFSSTWRLASEEHVWPVN